MQNPPVSIIVPTLNEAGNVKALLARIDATLHGHTGYEVIFIDDHSTDGTVRAIREAARYMSAPVHVYAKRGQKGKAYSLLEGFARAHYDLICMLDADLQYPPEAIPAMIARASAGADIVVANRAEIQTSRLRRSFSRLGRSLYGKWLHGLDCDVQSGMKLFRKAILARVDLNPTSWTFDLEFLVQARGIGYYIMTVEIPFAERTSGDSKINVLEAGWEILLGAMRVKLNQVRKHVTQA